MSYRRILSYVPRMMCALLVLVNVPAFAGQTSTVQNIKPHEAWAKVARHQVILIDVRSPAEWRQSGVPETARLVTLNDPRGVKGFLNGVRKIARGNMSQPIAVICRTGNRSLKAATLLTQNGFKTVYNVTEGVAGIQKGTGWAARGLPMVNCHDCNAEN